MKSDKPNEMQDTPASSFPHLSRLHMQKADFKAHLAIKDFFYKS